MKHQGGVEIFQEACRASISRSKFLCKYSKWADFQQIFSKIFSFYPRPIPLSYAALPEMKDSGRSNIPTLTRHIFINCSASIFCSIRALSWTQEWSKDKLTTFFLPFVFVREILMDFLFSINPSVPKLYYNIPWLYNNPLLMISQLQVIISCV